VRVLDDGVGRRAGKAAPVARLTWECGAVHVLALQCSVKRDAMRIAANQIGPPGGGTGQYPVPAVIYQLRCLLNHNIDGKLAANDQYHERVGFLLPPGTLYFGPSLAPALGPILLALVVN
jgi:hypothetical protein